MSDEFVNQYLVYFNQQIARARIKGKRTWERWFEVVQKKRNVCKHEHTRIDYRDNFACGDVICWKEYCLDCNRKTDRRGIGLYKPDVDYPNTIINEDTIYEGGYKIQYVKI